MLEAEAVAVEGVEVVLEEEEAGNGGTKVDIGTSSGGLSHWFSITGSEILTEMKHFI